LSGQFSLKAIFLGITVVSLWLLAPLAYWPTYGRFFLVGELIGIGIAAAIGAMALMIRGVWTAGNERPRDRPDF
jgi:uncharacterized membrane protein YedE/YeeE